MNAATALARAASARVTLILGDSNTGKTALAARLANGLLARGYSVGIVDADLGQSEIGPPTTVGLGRVRRPLTRLADADLVAMEFVGATSMAGDPGATVAGARRLLDRGLASFERMIVDTCGLVAGGFGGALKRRQIDALAPDVVVALQREAECEHILRSYGDRPAIVRLRPRTGVRRRTATERRAHRERALDRYFARAREVSIDLSRVARGVMSADLEGVLVGLHDGAGETLGLGWIRGVDAAGGRLTICATVAGDSVVSVTVGRTTYRRDRAHGAAGRRVDDRRRGARAS